MTEFLKQLLWDHIKTSFLSKGMTCERLFVFYKPQRGILRAYAIVKTSVTIVSLQEPGVFDFTRILPTTQENVFVYIDEDVHYFTIYFSFIV
jgi:hypothetical protein